MILVIDNYDSFTYNLVHYLAELGAPTRVVRNDLFNVKEALAFKPSALLLSPGPCAPDQAGICLDLLAAAPPGLPILGVCLGHQAIAQAYGGVVGAAKTIMHGKTSLVRHDGTGLFEGLPNPFSAARYHSLATPRLSLPDHLRVTAWTEDDEVMGLQHVERPIYGVQFHPESIATVGGKAILSNFLTIAGLVAV
jgi:anthranilate synthase component 2